MQQIFEYPLLLVTAYTYNWIHQKLKKFGSVRNRYLQVGNMYIYHVWYIKVVVFHHCVVFFWFSIRYDHPLWHSMWVILNMSQCIQSNDNIGMWCLKTPLYILNMHKWYKIYAWSTLLCNFLSTLRSRSYN